MEIFKDIKGYEGLYQISNLGRVKSLKFEKHRILKIGITYNGYNVIYLKNINVKINLIHRLIAQAFIPNPDDKRTVNHINGDKTDNRIVNLEWATYSENCQHAYDTGLSHGPKGSINGISKLTESQVLQIRKLANETDLFQWQIGEMFGVHQNLISRIKNRKIWKHI